jgi:hypothetical protein
MNRASSGCVVGATNWSQGGRRGGRQAWAWGMVGWEEEEGLHSSWQSSRRATRKRVIEEDGRQRKECRQVGEGTRGLSVSCSVCDFLLVEAVGWC